MQVNPKHLPSKSIIWYAEHFMYSINTEH